MLQPSDREKMLATLSQEGHEDTLSSDDDVVKKWRCRELE